MQCDPFSAMLDEFSELHAKVDTHGMSTTYYGDAQATREVLVNYLDDIGTDRLMSHLKTVK